MTIPNAITILRILLVPPFVIVLLRGQYGSALGIFALAAISDAVDGYIARRYLQKSRIGAFLDPLADKLLAGTAFILLAVRHIIPDWLAVIVVSREFVILFGLFLLTVVHAPIQIAPSRMGKLNTAFQLSTVCLCLLANARCSSRRRAPRPPSRGSSISSEDSGRWPEGIPGDRGAGRGPSSPQGGGLAGHGGGQNARKNALTEIVRISIDYG
jgi:cardiolipin synthase